MERQTKYDRRLADIQGWPKKLHHVITLSIVSIKFLAHIHTISIRNLQLDDAFEAVSQI